MSAPKDPINYDEGDKTISEFNKGYKRTEEQHKKMIENMRLYYKNNPGCRSGENNSNYGKVTSKETRRKISESLHGKKVPPRSKKYREKMSAAKKENKNMLGKKHTEECRKKMSTSNKGKTIPENTKLKIIESSIGGFWYGNIKENNRAIYCELWTEEFRNRVRAYYGYCCVVCGTPQNGNKHAVHHVHYNKKTCCKAGEEVGGRRFVLLCKSCHSKTNFNRSFWEQHFTDMVNHYYQGKCYFTKEEMKAFTNTQILIPAS